MKQRFLSIILALSLSVSSLSVAHASQGPLQPEKVPKGTDGTVNTAIGDDDGNTAPKEEEGNLTEELPPAGTLERNDTVPTPTQAL